MTPDYSNDGRPLGELTFSYTMEDVLLCLRRCKATVYRLEKTYAEEGNRLSFAQANELGHAKILVEVLQKRVNEWT